LGKDPEIVHVNNFVSRWLDAGFEVVNKYDAKTLIKASQEDY
jgi:hypothetical protein